MPIWPIDPPEDRGDAPVFVDMCDPDHAIDPHDARREDGYWIDGRNILDDPWPTEGE